MVLSDCTATREVPPLFVETVTLGEIISAIANGWRDFRRAPQNRLFFGTVNTIGGWPIFSLLGGWG